MTVVQAAKDDVAVTDEVPAEFRSLPPDLRDAALGLLAALCGTRTPGDLSVREAAAVIAAPSVRQVLEQEALINRLGLTG